MTIKTINKSIDINAPQEKVWNTLFNNETYKIWAAEFAEGSKAETDWQAGSKVLFTDDSHSGLVGEIIKSLPYEILSIEYYGAVQNGAEDTESEMAKSMKGAIETYKLEEKGSGTHLVIACDMDEQYYDMMNEAWDRALTIIKTLAEK